MGIAWIVIRFWEWNWNCSRLPLGIVSQGAITRTMQQRTYTHTHTISNHLLHTDSPLSHPFVYHSLPPVKCVCSQTNHLVKLSGDLPAALSTRAMHTLYIPARLSIYISLYISYYAKRVESASNCSRHLIESILKKKDYNINLQWAAWSVGANAKEASTLPRLLSLSPPLAHLSANHTANKAHKGTKA